VTTRKLNGKWYADFRFQHADGTVERIRKRSPIQSKAGAEEFERQLRTAMLAPTYTTKEVPSFAQYADDFMNTYVLANNKPSERSMKAGILKHHLLPNPLGGVGAKTRRRRQGRAAARGYQTDQLVGRLALPAAVSGGESRTEAESCCEARLRRMPCSSTSNRERTEWSEPVRAITHRVIKRRAACFFSGRGFATTS